MYSMYVRMYVCMYVCIDIPIRPKCHRIIGCRCVCVSICIFPNCTAIVYVRTVCMYVCMYVCICSTVQYSVGIYSNLAHYLSPIAASRRHCSCRTLASTRRRSRSACPCRCLWSRGCPRARPETACTCTAKTSGLFGSHCQG